MDVDVLFPFHRNDRYLREAVSSLQTTLGVSFRVIAIDDRIDDKTDVTELFRNFKSYDLISTAGGEGYGKALEVASKNISSDIVALFNSDDLVHPKRLSKQVRMLESSEICITSMQRITADNKTSRALSGEIESRTYHPAYLLFGAYGANATWCMRNAWWRQNAFFDNMESLDWRIALATFNNSLISFIPEALYSYRRHSNQVTARKDVPLGSILPVFDSWKKLAEASKLNQATLENFFIYALPWHAGTSTSVEALNEFKASFFENFQSLEKDILDSINNLIQRRFLIALRNGGNLRERKLLLKAGFPQIPNLLGDVFHNITL
jgi:glycosyltransferase involved in cell wall biosynthesis